jgi:hypothetical protein
MDEQKAHNTHRKFITSPKDDKMDLKPVTMEKLVTFCVSQNVFCSKFTQTLCVFVYIATFNKAKWLGAIKDLVYDGGIC